MKNVDISEPVAMVSQIFLMNVEAALDALDAAHAEQFISSVIGIVAHGLKQHQWDKIMKAAEVPCGAKGCECEKVRQDMVKAMNLARLAIQAVQSKEEPKKGNYGNN